MRQQVEALREQAIEKNETISALTDHVRELLHDIDMLRNINEPRK